MNNRNQPSPSTQSSAAKINIYKNQPSNLALPKVVEINTNSLNQPSTSKQPNVAESSINHLNQTTILVQPNAVKRNINNPYPQLPLMQLSVAETTNAPGEYESINL